MQLSVGVGALHPGWTAFERGTGRAERALLLDEGLAVYDGLMRGQPFSFRGQRYDVRETDSFPPRRPCSGPACRCGWWARSTVPCRCGVRWRGTGCCPTWSTAARRVAPAELSAVVAQARELRTSLGLPWDGFDVVAEGRATDVREWADAGATWWTESDWETTVDAVRARITAGPPSGTY